jgi:pimeloyl-ACP methyl ester carboxylesterase
VAAPGRRRGARAAARRAVVSTRERRVALARGIEARIWERGDGDPVVFLGGLRGLPRWPAFLDALARTRRVIAPSLPGFPGGMGHRTLDALPDWVIATLDLLDACAEGPVDLVGASLGASLAAEIAAFSRASVRRLVLIAPLGLFDGNEPPADLFAQRLSAVPRLLCAHPERYDEFLARPDGADPVEWEIETARAQEAVARLLWPLTDTGLTKRLHRITAPTLVAWGAEDRLVPPSYAKRFADALGGPAEIRQIPGAGHMAELDAPEELADCVMRFLSASDGLRAYSVDRHTDSQGTPSPSPSSRRR